MARQNPDDIAEELIKQDAENYGEGTISGTDGPPEPIDIDEVAVETFGNNRALDDELDLEEEIEKDEKEIAGLPEDADI